ncbi:MAG: hypothetical protein ACREJB_07850, partial [Planctomycetaceae bacterium]
APTKPAGKKLSPLERARRQGAFKTEGQAAPARQETAVAEKPSPVTAEEPAPEPVEDTATATAEPVPAAQPKQNATPKTGPGGRPLTIPELARLQGPFKG